MTANPHRGEVEIVLGERRVTLRPSFAALVEIERRLGIGLLPLAVRFRTRQIGIGDMAVLVHACWTGTPKPEPEQVGELVTAAGMVDLVAPLTELIHNALTGGSKNAAAPASSETAPGAAASTS